MLRLFVPALLLLAVPGRLSAGFCADIAISQNLTYATVDGVSLQLDLAQPAEGEGPFPTLVFIHGGGWSGGNRHSYRASIEGAARRGYVAATISYRLTQPDANSVPKVPFPAQIHDCKAAVRWLRAHAKDYRIDPERMAAIGGSAGGHLSLLVGLTDKNDRLEGDLGNPDQSSRVQAVVNIYGPTELKSLYETTPVVQGLLKALCNGTPEQVADTYRQASPVTFITADDPLILTLHGDADEIVPVQQARLLDDQLKAAKLNHELIVLAGQGHGFQGPAAVEAQAAIWKFLDARLKPVP